MFLNCGIAHRQCLPPYAFALPSELASLPPTASPEEKPRCILYFKHFRRKYRNCSLSILHYPLKCLHGKGKCDRGEVLLVRFLKKGAKKRGGSLGIVKKFIDKRE